MAVGVRGIYRKWNNLVDDVKTIDNDGNLILTPRNSRNVPHRSYKAIELTFEKRFTGNWQALVNYTLSRAYGNQFSELRFAALRFPGRDVQRPNGIGDDPLHAWLAARTSTASPRTTGRAWPTPSSRTPGTCRS